MANKSEYKNTSTNNNNFNFNEEDWLKLINVLPASSIESLLSTCKRLEKQGQLKTEQNVVNSNNVTNNPLFCSPIVEQIAKTSADSLILNSDLSNICFKNAKSSPIPSLHDLPPSIKHCRLPVNTDRPSPDVQIDNTMRDVSETCNLNCLASAAIAIADKTNELPIYAIESTELPLNENKFPPKLDQLEDNEKMRNNYHCSSGEASFCCVYPPILSPLTSTELIVSSSSVPPILGDHTRVVTATSALQRKSKYKNPTSSITKESRQSPSIGQTPKRLAAAAATLAEETALDEDPNPPNTGDTISRCSKRCRLSNCQADLQSNSIDSTSESNSSYTYGLGSLNCCHGEQDVSLHDVNECNKHLNMTSPPSYTADNQVIYSGHQPLPQASTNKWQFLDFRVSKRNETASEITASIDLHRKCKDEMAVDDEAARREKRRERNRVAAAKCRQNRQNQIQNLNSKVQSLTETRIELNSQLQNAELKKLHLEEIIRKNGLAVSFETNATAVKQTVINPTYILPNTSNELLLTKGRISIATDVQAAQLSPPLFSWCTKQLTSSSGDKLPESVASMAEIKQSEFGSSYNSNMENNIKPGHQFSNSNILHRSQIPFEFGLLLLSPSSSESSILNSEKPSFAQLSSNTISTIALSKSVIKDQSYSIKKEPSQNTYNLSSHEEVIRPVTLKFHNQNSPNEMRSRQNLTTKLSKEDTTPVYSSHSWLYEDSAFSSIITPTVYKLMEEEIISGKSRIPVIQKNMIQIERELQHTQANIKASKSVASHDCRNTGFDILESPGHLITPVSTCISELGGSTIFNITVTTNEASTNVQVSETETPATS